MTPLLLEPFDRSLDALQKTLERYDALIDAPALDHDLVAILRTAGVKNFEMSYELAWKLIDRRLVLDQGEAAPDRKRTRRDLFRLAADAGLISAPEAWFDFHDARNPDAHAYREEVAAASFAVARAFLAAGRALLRTLRNFNDG